jgi:hypothetical protein
MSHYIITRQYYVPYESHEITIFGICEEESMANEIVALLTTLAPYDHPTLEVTYKAENVPVLQHGYLLYLREQERVEQERKKIAALPVPLIPVSSEDACAALAKGGHS